MKKRIVAIIFLMVLIVSMSGCGGKNDNVTSTSENKQVNSVSENNQVTESPDATESNQEIFKVSDFIGEPDNRITKATGGRAYKLDVIPCFPDADKQFKPSTEDYCLMSYQLYI